MEQDRVGTNDIAGVVREIVPAVVYHRFECPNCTGKGSLTIVQTREGKAEGKTNAIDRGVFQGVVVECPVSKGNVDIMVH